MPDDIHTSGETQVVRLDNNAAIDWQIDNYAPQTKIRLDVDQDPGGGFGKRALAEAPDAGTDPKSGVGHFTMRMTKEGKFVFTLTVKKPDAPETAAVTIDVAPLAYRVFDAPGAAEPDKPFKVHWSVDRGNGCEFALVTTAPDQQQWRTGVTIDDHGDGSTQVTPSQMGEYTFVLESTDKFLPAGYKSPSSAPVHVTVRPPLVVELELTGPEYQTPKSVGSSEKVWAVHQLRKDADGRPTVRGGRPFRVVWSVKAIPDLSGVESIRFIDSGQSGFAELHFEKASNLARGNQEYTLQATNTAPEQRTFSVVCLGPDEKELARKDVAVTCAPALDQNRRDMLALIDDFFPSSLYAPRRRGQPVVAPERDIFQICNYTKEQGIESQKNREANDKTMAEWKKNGSPQPEPTLIPIVTSCGDVMGAMLRQWQSTFWGAFAIVDEGKGVPPGTPIKDPKHPPGARELGYYHEAQAGELPEPGDVYVLFDAKGRQAHVGIVVDFYDKTWMSADGGAGSLENQEAIVGHKNWSVSGSSIMVTSPTDMKQKHIGGWVDLSLLGRDKTKPPPV